MAPRPLAPMAVCHSQPCTPRKGKKVNCFLKTGRIFIWNDSFRAQIRLRMHLRASRTLWLQTPGRNGSVLQANSPAHQERVEKVNDFLKTGRISIWNNSFRAQIRMRMHLRAPRTLWFLGAAPRPQPQWQCATVSPVHQEKVKKVNCFLKTGRISVWNNSFRAQIRLRMHLWASSTFLASGGRSRPPDPPRPQW